MDDPGQSRNSSGKNDSSTAYLIVHVSLASNILNVHASMSFYKNALRTPSVAHSVHHLCSCIPNCWGIRVAVRTGVTVNVGFPTWLGISETWSNVFILPDPLSLSQSPQHGRPLSYSSMFLSVLLICLEPVMKREPSSFLRESLAFSPRQLFPFKSINQSIYLSLTGKTKTNSKISLYFAFSHLLLPIFFFFFSSITTEF